MSIRVALQHCTSYRYDRLVTLSPQVVRLRPAPHCRTPVTSYSLKVTPEKHFLNWQQDPHGNFIARLVFPEQTRQFKLQMDLVAELTVVNPFDFFLEAEATTYPFVYSGWLESELATYRTPLPLEPKLKQFLASVPRTASSTIDFLVDLNRVVHEAVKYVIRMEPGVQTCEETLTRGSGSCRDSAWLLVQALRQLGLAARFVSGYLIQLKPDVKPLDGPAGTDHDFTDLHAWAEVYLPGGGWIGLDPTSGLLTGEGHLPLAATPDPASAAPIAGAVDECETTFEFSMHIERIHEDPRVTKPYTVEQWQRIEKLGHQVDSALEKQAVRLTMGGEPTFVSIEDMDSPEWNTAAFGPHKRRLAGTLFQRLANRFSAQPLLHFGQGKWYPGETLPRWALGCYWRTDRHPVWQDPDFIAEDDVAYGHTERDAQRFVTELAERLNVGAQYAIPAYEDAWYYLWKERRLPINVDPLKSRLSNEEERLRLAKIFDRGLGQVVGYALPLQPRSDASDESRWQSSSWFLRSEHLFLLPGDSPMGFRLPLESIPWTAPEDQPRIYERDPFAERGPLPHYAGNGLNGHTRSQPSVRAGAVIPERVLVHQFAGVTSPLQREGVKNDNGGRRPSPHQGTAEATWLATSLATAPLSRQLGSASQAVRTAICVEAREGRLHVFMPPVGELESYLELLTKVEETARHLGLPVRIEGYTPPHDPRLQHFKITPDPGVIEVNLQPAHHWNDLVRHTTILYEEARQSRLGTEKFMLDGRHTGTGGGNHIVLGGATPAESPFLRRPDLLRSLVTYWNNRPSLSYLFSGLFVGPTSQAPRVDEARHESIYELETAFRQLPEEGPCPPWLVDRVFRNLLVDVTGNTHRCEFCIDKLYSPDSASGRLGLVEFRAFEMPPHARMSLTQQLLVRALIARFWETPYREPLVRWGTTLHDRFMLPHFVAQDFAEVLGELRAAGFPFESDWFDAHLEFRFPRLGHLTQQGISMELRHAIEPWHVLGEEAGGGATVRCVDSSVERLQVLVRGMTDSRHVVLCGGRRVPLHPTGVRGEFVAGVRYRAWQPASCLHPTIGIHTPLTFDLFDTWNDRSIGGCTWHVAHPGGRHFERFPVNAYEAEGRRAARFFPFGYTGGRQSLPPFERNQDYPLTLDLRRPVELGTP